MGVSFRAYAMISSRRRSVFTLLAALGTLLVGGTLYSRGRAQESRETTQIAPGVSMLAISTQTQSGPLRYWLIKADKAATKLALEVADGADVGKKRSVRDIAAQAGALVAVNGGFFAYDGAAVGAVKVAGEWHRLPWKSRTALGWDEKEARIGSLSKSCQLIVTLEDGTSDTYKAALNGFALPGTHTPLADGFAILTPRFAPKIKLKVNQSALLVRDNRVVARDLRGDFLWPADVKPTDFLVVMSGKAALDKPVKGVTWSILFGESNLDRFPNILGAGPLLVRDGIVKTTEKEEEFRPDVIARGPRTCVGFDAQGHTLFLVADGWRTASVGLTLPETAQLFRQLGAVQALNLDGGGSTQLVVNGKLLNEAAGFDPFNPLQSTGARVSNALILKRF